MKRTSEFVVLMLLLSVPAFAGSIVVDEPGQFDRAVELWQNAPIGQSFVATEGKVKTISLSLLDACPCGYPGDQTMVLLLREGEGFDGKILGKFVNFELPMGDVEAGWTDWVHEESVAVVIGRTYTIEIVASTTRWQARASDRFDDFYPDGSIWSGDEAFGGDFRFRVLDELPGRTKP
jgi:hypothetical protein